MGIEPTLMFALDARLNRFEAALKKAGTIGEKTAKEVESRFSRMNPQVGFLGSFAKQFIASTVAAVGLQQAITGIRDAVRQVDDISDAAERVGVSTDTFQALRYTLASLGGTAEIADRAMDKFADTMGEASLGGGYMAKVFKENQISFENANGTLKTTEQLLVDVARLTAGIEDPMQRLKFVVDNFGRQAGPQFVTTLLKIAQDGLPGVTQAAKDAGAVLDKDLFAANAKLEAQFVKMEAAFSTAYQKFMVEWGGPVLLSALDSVRMAFANIALAVQLIQAGRLREALGIVTQLEAAKQRLSMGAGTPLEGADDFFGPVKPPTRIGTIKKTVLPPVGGAGGGVGSKESIDAFERAIKAAEEHTAATIAETNALDGGAAAVARAKLELELRTAAMETNTKAGMEANTVTAEQEARIQAVADATYNATKAMEAAKGPLREFSREAADMNKNLQTAGVEALKGLEDALVDIVTGAATTEEAIKKMVDAILADLLRMAIRMSITGPIAGMIGGMFGGSGGMGLPMPFGRAAGGPVGAGRPYMVGERGPELFVPNGSGNIMPNQALSRGRGAFSIQIINNGAKVETSEPKTQSDGSTSLVIMVDKLTAKNGATPGTATNRMLRNQGATMPLVRRG